MTSYQIKKKLTSNLTRTFLQRKKDGKKKNLIRSLQITNTNVCKLKKTEETVRTEENKVPRSHQLVMKTEWPESESTATSGNERTRLHISHWIVHSCPILIYLPKLRQFMLGNLAIHLSKRRLARTRCEVENAHGVLLTTRVDSIRLDSTRTLEGRSDSRERRPQEPKLKSSINAQ